MSSPSPRPVAFYVHHHGGGHANRTRLLAAHWPDDSPLHVFTSAPERFAGWSEGTVHSLPPDFSGTRPDGIRDSVTLRDPALDLLQDRILHYAPVDLPVLQQRMAVLAGWIAEYRPRLFIVDLSVEVALFARLCGVRVALVRLHGHRDDPAHVGAFQLADRLIAPFPPELEDAHTPEWVRRKTIYLGAFSRYDERRETKADYRKQLDLTERQKVVTAINGLGGGAQVQHEWEAIARATPEWTFLLVGKVETSSRVLTNLRFIGRVADTFPYLKAADVVVGSGGTNTMMEVGAARVPFLSRPEERPFGEQVCKMRALERLGLTRIVPERIDPGNWSSLLAAAAAMEVSGWDILFGRTELRRTIQRLNQSFP